MASVPYEILDYPNSRFGRIEAMVPDLCLVFPRCARIPYCSVAEPISKYCNDAGIPFELGYHRFLVRYTTPSGRSRWVNDWFLFIIVLENIGDQMILKIMFPELR